MPAVAFTVTDDVHAPAVAFTITDNVHAPGVAFTITDNVHMPALYQGGPRSCPLAPFTPQWLQGMETKETHSIDGKTEAELTEVSVFSS